MGIKYSKLYNSYRIKMGMANQQVHTDISLIYLIDNDI